MRTPISTSYIRLMIRRLPCPPLLGQQPTAKSTLPSPRILFQSDGSPMRIHRSRITRITCPRRSLSHLVLVPVSAPESRCVMNGG